MNIPNENRSRRAANMLNRNWAVGSNLAHDLYRDNRATIAHHLATRAFLANVRDGAMNASGHPFIRPVTAHYGGPQHERCRTCGIRLAEHA